LTLLIALAIWLVDKGPVFYSHERITTTGKKFNCLKFRTMRVGAADELARILKENDMTVVQKKKRKRIENLLRIPLTNEMKQSKGIWSIDFMCGRKNNKFKFMLLNVINIGSRISPIMCVERSFTSFDVTYELEKGFVIDGKPSRIILIMGLNLQVHILKFGAKETISFII
jgi:hypothetical protein